MTRENLPSEPTVSLWSGIFLPIVYNGHHIVVHNSSWTSRMTIWVDGEVVFSRSSWKFICEQNIQVEAEALATRFGWAKRGFTLRSSLVTSSLPLPTIPQGRLAGSKFSRSCYWAWLSDSQSSILACFDLSRLTGCD